MNDEEPAVSSIPLDGENGEQIVISQQNVGPGSQVGGGEFKNVTHGKTPDAAAAEQNELEREAPVDEGSRSDSMRRADVANGEGPDGSSR